MLLNVNRTRRPVIPIYLFLILLLNVGTYFPSLAFQPLVSSKRVCFRGLSAHDDMDVLNNGLNNGLNNVDKAVLNRLLEGENKP